MQFEIGRPQLAQIPRIEKRGSPTLTFNSNDLRIIVPKRARWRGWTLNFGRPATWLILAFLIAAAIVIGYINSRH